MNPATYNPTPATWNSGTEFGDGKSDIAVAACYVSTKSGWDKFVEKWDRARQQEGFDSFHMAHFLAPPTQKEEPWCYWDNKKKTSVYNRLAKIINDNKRIGIALAVPKATYDTVPDRVKRRYGREHYTFAVRMCMNRIVDWRKASSLMRLPVQYTFDWEMQRTPKREEINKIFDLIANARNQEVANLLGVEAGGYGFQHKEQFKPLQAADILAWQMRSHMGKIWPLGHDDESLCHPGFRLLREDQEMDLGFFTKNQITEFVDHFDKISAIYPHPEVYD